MRENSITLRSTPAARGFMRLMGTINTGSFDEIYNYILSEFSSEILRSYNAEELTNYCMTVYTETDGLAIHKVFLSEEYVIMVVMKPRNQDNVLFLDKLKVSPTAPFKVTEYVHQEFNPANYGI